MDQALVLALEYFESVDGVRRGLDVENVPLIKDKEDELFDEPDWTLELWPSINDNFRLNVR